MVQETAQILGQLDAAAVQIMMPVQVALVTWDNQDNAHCNRRTE
jgi:hypothetical protein